MSCGKCGGNSRCICPVSLGVALGLTCALGVVFTFVWVTYVGSLPAAMPHYMEPAASWGDAFTRALWALGKGFVCGFLIALFYDLIACYCKGRCCKKPDGNGGGCCDKADGSK